MSKRKRRYEDVLAEMTGNTLNARDNRAFETQGFESGSFCDCRRDDVLGIEDRNNRKSSDNDILDVEDDINVNTRKTSRNDVLGIEDIEDRKNRRPKDGVLGTEVGSNNSLCRRFARILDSNIVESKSNICVVTRQRDIEVCIKGIETESPLVVNATFSFETGRNSERTLNLGETVLLEKEVRPFIHALKERDIRVTAVERRWMFDEPKLFYANFLFIGNPIEFANRVAEAFKKIERRA